MVLALGPVSHSFMRSSTQAWKSCGKRRTLPGPQAIGALDARLEDAVYLERDEIPANVATMNSTVELVDLRTHECFLVTLVLP
jgi:transcription elongation GreA/GreB family factor